MPGGGFESHQHRDDAADRDDDLFAFCHLHFMTCASVVYDGRAVQVPCGVAKDRHDNGKAEEKR